MGINSRYEVIITNTKALESQALNFSYLHEARQCADRLSFFLGKLYVIDLYQIKEKMHIDEEGEFTNSEIVDIRKLLF